MQWWWKRDQEGFQAAGWRRNYGDRKMLLQEKWSYLLRPSQKSWLSTWKFPTGRTEIQKNIWMPVFPWTLACARICAVSWLKVPGRSPEETGPALGTETPVWTVPFGLLQPALPGIICPLLLLCGILWSLHPVLRPHTSRYTPFSKLGGTQKSYLWNWSILSRSLNWGCGWWGFSSCEFV